MNLQFNTALAKGYVSNSQIARVLTESWVKENIYCPNCGEPTISAYENNKPVADFYCIICVEDFELKSKSSNFASKIVDGAFDTMIARVLSAKNPNFFFLTYNKIDWKVNNLAIIPRYFFTPEIVEKRKPLTITAKRAGWVGCNINLTKIPNAGKIFFIKNSVVQDKDLVLKSWRKTIFLKEAALSSRIWTLDVLSCLDKIKSKDFKLADIYAFETELQEKHPNNKYVKDKVRQQLQILRDRGILEFTSRGAYRKLENEQSRYK